MHSIGPSVVVKLGSKREKLLRPSRKLAMQSLTFHRVTRAPGLVFGSALSTGAVFLYHVHHILIWSILR
jgi:hypothetical protein